MKRANKTLATLLAAGLTLGAAGTAFAFGGHDRGCSGFDSRTASPMRALYQLDSLSDEQRTQIKEVMKEERQSMRDLMDAMQDNRDAMLEANKDNVTVDKIKPLAKKQGELIAEMTVARAQLRDKINAILTDEQRKELNNMKSSKRFDKDDDRGRDNYQGW